MGARPVRPHHPGCLDSDAGRGFGLTMVKPYIACRCRRGSVRNAKLIHFPDKSGGVPRDLRKIMNWLVWKGPECLGKVSAESVLEGSDGSSHHGHVWSGVSVRGLFGGGAGVEGVEAEGVGGLVGEGQAEVVAGRHLHHVGLADEAHVAGLLLDVFVFGAAQLLS